MFSRCSQDVCRIFPGCLQDAPMGLVGLVEFDDNFKWKYGLQWSKGTWWSQAIQWSQLFDDPHLFDDPQLFDGGIWWSFQMKVWTSMIQRISMIPSYSMIPAIRWSPAIWWSPAIRWSIGSMDFGNPKVYGDTSIIDGLVIISLLLGAIVLIGMKYEL